MLVSFRIKTSITTARRAVGEFNKAVPAFYRRGKTPLTLCAKTHTLTFRGERAAMKDGERAVIMALCASEVPDNSWGDQTGALQSVEAIEYETSDTRLAWFEVRDDLLCREAAEDEAEADMEAFSASYPPLGGGSPRARRHA